MQDTKPLRVLLVDDSENFLGALRAFFATIGGVEIVGEARSGEQAVAFAELRSPDFVIMDLAMPGIGGLEATRILKLLPLAPRLLVLTLHDDDCFREAALEAGADFFIAKDRLLDEFPTLLATVLRP